MAALISDCSAPRSTTGECDQCHIHCHFKNHESGLSKQSKTNYPQYRDLPLSYYDSYVQNVVPAVSHPHVRLVRLNHWTHEHIFYIADSSAADEAWLNSFTNDSPSQREERFAWRLFRANQRLHEANESDPSSCNGWLDDMRIQTVKSIERDPYGGHGIDPNMTIKDEVERLEDFKHRLERRYEHYNFNESINNEDIVPADRYGNNLRDNEYSCENKYRDETEEVNASEQVRQDGDGEYNERIENGGDSAAKEGCQ